ncbi:hypothetical protein [Rhizobium sp. FKY42]|uniref:hypothetical protein n=1 Tax=Rhizobium sp. FKY42 TaxID=2562310 RepID=UPI0010C0D2CB|nr:hypothetical protein [Rhizobium sp. FKY42]
MTALTSGDVGVVGRVQRPALAANMATRFLNVKIVPGGLAQSQLPAIARRLERHVHAFIPPGLA